MSKLPVSSALALLLFNLAVAPVVAQVPYIQAYFCPANESAVCNDDVVLSKLCIYSHNFHATYDAVEFAVSYPAAVTWLSDHPIDAFVSLGDTPNGITLGWIAPFKPPHVPSLLMTVTVGWNCSTCLPPYLNNPITIVPHPGPGHIAYTDVATATIWPAVGMKSMICSSLPMEETTWSKVKALYTE